MNQPSSTAYQEALSFWNTAFSLSEDAKARYEKAYAQRQDGINLARSQTLARMIADELAHQQKVLDYGCGEGWASICLTRAGCPDVTNVDLSANAVARSEYLRVLYGVEKQMHPMCVDIAWLSKAPENTYDGIVCSNVLDVIPTETAQDILFHFHRIAKPGARIIISLNYYMEPRDNPEKHIVIQNGNQVFLDGVLRMVTHTDESWQEMLEKHFTVKKLNHYAWDGEETPRRRMFILEKA